MGIFYTSADVSRDNVMAILGEYAANGTVDAALVKIINSIAVNTTLSEGMKSSMLDEANATRDRARVALSEAVALIGASKYAAEIAKIGQDCILSVNPQYKRIAADAGTTLDLFAPEKEMADVVAAAGLRWRNIGIAALVLGGGIFVGRKFLRRR